MSDLNGIYLRPDERVGERLLVRVVADGAAELDGAEACLGRFL